MLVNRVDQQQLGTFKDVIALADECEDAISQTNDLREDVLRTLFVAILKTVSDLMSIEQLALVDDVIELEEVCLRALLPMVKKYHAHRHGDYNEYLKSPEWASIKRSVHCRDKFQCQKCGVIGTAVPGSVGVVLHVHHLTYERRGCELLSDLQTLCSTCHAAVHGQSG